MIPSDDLPGVGFPGRTLGPPLRCGDLIAVHGVPCLILGPGLFGAFGCTGANDVWTTFIALCDDGIVQVNVRMSSIPVALTHSPRTSIGWMSSRGVSWTTTSSAHAGPLGGLSWSPRDRGECSPRVTYETPIFWPGISMSRYPR